MKLSMPFGSARWKTCYHGIDKELVQHTLIIKVDQIFFNEPHCIKFYYGNIALAALLQTTNGGNPIPIGLVLLSI